MRVNLRIDLGSRPDPRRYLITQDDGGQHVPPAAAQVFSHGQRAGSHVDGRMAAAHAVAFVHLQGDAGGGVDHGRPNGLRAVRMTDDAGLAGAAHIGGQAGEVGVFGPATAGQDCADGVQGDVFGGGDGARRQVFKPRVGDKVGQLIEVVLWHGWPLDSRFRGNDGCFRGNDG